MLSRCLTLSLFLSAAWLVVAGTPARGVDGDSAATSARTVSRKNERRATPVRWLDNYGRAMAEAEKQGRMLLIDFFDPQGDDACRRFESETLSDPQVRKQLRRYVCLRLPVSAKIKMRGKDAVLLEQDAFEEMHGKPGIAVVDFRSRRAPLRGAVVSMFPITDRLDYSPEQMAVILDLPRGTLTQRTLIFAVRTHPEKPASTDGEPLPDLLEEAESHSQYQASIQVQGHHFWDTRFGRIIARLPGGLGAREVCAESWPGDNLVEAAVECVRSWRQSSGHWNAVSSEHPFFGYDMKRGQNGVWYATGIFGGG
ncbi:MAG: thioredoxin family protein [Thermoguttaceae bacterium]